MKYYIKEKYLNNSESRNAGSKARNDAEEIARRNGFEELPLLVTQNKSNNIFMKIIDQYSKYENWCGVLNDLKAGDVLFLQFPVVEDTVLLSLILERLSKRGIRIIILIHDLQYIRFSDSSSYSYRHKKKLQIEEITCLKKVDAVIVHNIKMAKYIETLGVDSQKIVNLQIFDYLMEPFESKNNVLGATCIVAGNLSKIKAGYLYNMPSNIEVNAYGIGVESELNDNIHYQGSFEPAELPKYLVGDYGLVWDGDSIDGCEGVYGKYLKINAPHKTSLYLASGIPVVIWNQAALCDFIVENGCGFGVASISEITDVVNKMPIEKYNEIRSNAEKLGSKIRNGYFLTEAIRKSMLL